MSYDDDNPEIYFIEPNDDLLIIQNEAQTLYEDENEEEELIRYTCGGYWWLISNKSEGPFSSFKELEKFKEDEKIKLERD